MSSIFSQPEDVPETQPDTAGLLDEARAAWSEVLATKTDGWNDVFAIVAGHAGLLTRITLLKAHAALGELNNLLLPPLLTLVVLQMVEGILPPAVELELDGISLLFGGSFAVEWTVGLYLARCRRAYVSNFWLVLDLVSSVPVVPALQMLRVARVARILRFMRLLKLLRARRFGLPVGRLLRAFSVSVSIATAGAMALQAMEPRLVPSFGDAFWWAFVTLSTVGYGDITPETPGGRFVAMVLMIVGIGLFSYLAGVMATAVFDPEEDEMLAALARLEVQVAKLAEKMETDGE
jgi:voltage-gated potassium channel